MVENNPAPSLARRARIALSVFIAATGLSISMATVSVPKADAAWTPEWCGNVWLAPYGSSGDRCMMGQGYANHYETLLVRTLERAGCVAAAGYHGEQVMNWVCAPAGGNFAVIYPPNPEGWYRGMVRNNNLSKWGQFTGLAFCESRCV